MNNLAYASQDPQKVAPKVEELLRAELGSAEPLAYEIEVGDAGKTTVGSVLLEGVGLIFGRSESRLFSIIFNLTQPRPARVEIHLNRQGVGCHGGSILYSTRLSKATKGKVSLEDPKFLGSSKFVGDADGSEAAQKLNASKEVVKLANAFARVKANVGGVDITAPRFFNVAAHDGGTVLAAATLPRSYAMGFKISMEGKEFMQLAGLIEAAL